MSWVVIGEWMGDGVVVGVDVGHGMGYVLWRREVWSQLYWQVQLLLERIVPGNLSVWLF